MLLCLLFPQATRKDLYEHTERGPGPPIPYMMQMANIRGACHMGDQATRTRATEKAYHQVNGALAGWKFTEEG